MPHISIRNQYSSRYEAVLYDEPATTSWLTNEACGLDRPEKMPFRDLFNEKYWLEYT